MSDDSSNSNNNNSNNRDSSENNNKKRKSSQKEFVEENSFDKFNSQSPSSNLDSETLDVNEERSLEVGEEDVDEVLSMDDRILSAG